MSVAGWSRAVLRASAVALRCFCLLAILAAPAHADGTEPVRRAYVRDIKLFRMGKPDIDLNDGLIRTFKKQLETFHYSSDDCESVLAWAAEHPRRESFDDSANHERLARSEHCSPPPNALVFDVELVIATDPELGNRRAVLRFIGVYDRAASRSGGYAQKAGEPTIEWEGIIAGAIERTLEGYNDPTAISLIMPDDTTVGETLRLDARRSWDQDGESFELRWRVTTTACIGKGRPLPIDHQSCPEGSVRGPLLVETQAGAHANTREFRVPMIGDYDIAIHAKVGDREEPDRVFHIHAYPRRSNTFFSRVGVLGLPHDFLRSGLGATPALLISVGFLHRIAHRIGFAGWYEEVHLGASLGSMQPVQTLSLKGTATASPLGIEVLARTLDRTGHFGLSLPVTISGFLGNAERGSYTRLEGGFHIETMAGAYVAFGENYVDERESFCGSVCPSITVGPTLSVLLNGATGQTGVVGGGELLMGVEF